MIGACVGVLVVVGVVVVGLEGVGQRRQGVSWQDATPAAARCWGGDHRLVGLDGEGVLADFAGEHDLVRVDDRCALYRCTQRWRVFMIGLSGSVMFARLYALTPTGRGRPRAR